MKFGFSAFLRLLSMNEKPQRTLIKNRFIPSGNGYDFHRSLKLALRRYAEGVTIKQLIEDGKDISNNAEKISYKAALNYINGWMSGAPESLINYPANLYTSPLENFQVNFTPDLCISIGEKRTLVHVWNTKGTELSPHMTYAALNIFSNVYEDVDLAVLYIPDKKLYKLSDVGDYSEVSNRVVNKIDMLVESVEGDLKNPKSPPHDQPFV